MVSRPGQMISGSLLRFAANHRNCLSSVMYQVLPPFMFVATVTTGKTYVHFLMDEADFLYKFYIVPHFFLYILKILLNFKTSFQNVVDFVD